MYMPGRLRTASSPSRTVMSWAPQVDFPLFSGGVVANPCLSFFLHEKARPGENSARVGEVQFRYVKYSRSSDSFGLPAGRKRPAKRHVLPVHDERVSLHRLSRAISGPHDEAQAGHEGR